MKIRLLLMSILTAASASAQTLKRVAPETVGMSGERLAYADSAILKAIDAGDIPGAVLAVVKDGKMAYIKAYGFRSLVPKKEKMTVGTVFDLASCTKPVATAMSVMKLVERGMIRLNDPVSMYIPEFKNWVSADGKSKATIRIKHLLTHTSGLPPYASVSELQKRYGAVQPDSLMSYIAGMRRDFAPGTDCQYSCLNFITLQNIVQRLSGMSLRDFARLNVFAPLGMNHTDYIPCKENKKGEWVSASAPVWADGGKGDDWRDIVAPTEKQPNGQVLRGIVHDPLARVMNGGVSGNAGLFSNADDLALLCAAILNGGQLNGMRVLSPSTVRLMTSLADGLEKFGRTPGWDMSSDYSSNLGDMLSSSAIGHTGFTGTMIDIDPENNLAIILLTNSVHPDGHTNVIRLRAVVANAVAASITGDERTDHYKSRMQEFASAPAITRSDIVMLGNSLTENGGDWSKRLGNTHVVNRGIIGDDVPGIYERLYQILPFHPAKIFLMEGINDLSHDLSAAEIAQSVELTVKRIRRESPSTKLILQSLLPINESFNRYKRLAGKTDTVPVINALLKSVAKRNDIDFIDLFPLFKESDSNSMRKELSVDGLHLNADGYKIWVDELKKRL